MSSYMEREATFLRRNAIEGTNKINAFVHCHFCSYFVVRVYCNEKAERCDDKKAIKFIDTAIQYKVIIFLYKIIFSIILHNKCLNIITTS